jgi:hypothetical protein
MLVCVPYDLLRTGSLCSSCSLVLPLCSLVVLTVLFVPMHASLLFSHCVTQHPLCILLFRVFCLNDLYLWFLCSYVPLP